MEERINRIQRLFSIAEQFLPLFTNLKGLEGRGVAMAIVAIEDPLETTLSQRVIGFLPNDNQKIEKMLDFTKKELSLLSRGNKSKRQIEGIEANNFYVTVNGFSARYNHEFALLVCLIAGELTAIKFLEISQGVKERVGSSLNTT